MQLVSLLLVLTIRIVNTVSIVLWENQIAQKCYQNKYQNTKDK